MELKTHDLIQISCDEPLIIADGEIPAWVKLSLKKAPFVVVRHAKSKGNCIPIGIRGPSRGQRFATAILYHHSMKHITPEDIVEKKIWRHTQRFCSIPALSVLDKIDAFFNEEKLAWGPTGSVGFELATGVDTAHNTSDLDIVIRAERVLNIKYCKKILKFLFTLNVKIDAQLEIPQGILSLEEYARGVKPFIVRSLEGPKLMIDPWDGKGEPLCR